MEKKITLIQPPIFKSEMSVDKIQEAYWSTLNRQMNLILEETNLNNGVDEYHAIEPNIGLLYIASSLKKSGCDLRYVDFTSVDNEVRENLGRPIEYCDIQKEISKVSEDFLQIVGISCMTANFKWGMMIADEIKRVNENSVVILGGVHGSFDYENILNNYNSVDIVAIGEGEETLVDLVDTIVKKGKNIGALSNVKGIAFKKLDEIYVTQPREYIQDLDSLPYPMYDLLSNQITDNVMIRVITSRGCSNNCSFCVPTKVFNSLRFRKVQCVVDELEYYYKNKGWRLFMIGDLNFLNDYQYAMDFCDELIKRKLDIYWVCQSRVDLISEEVVVKMKKAGCILICLGIESANQEILDKTNKMTTVEMSLSACRTVKNAGIRLYTYWVFGLPYETHDSAHATIKLLRRCIDEKLIDFTHCTMCVPFPGTDIYKKPEENGIHIVSFDYDDFWMGCDYLGAGIPVIETDELSKYEIYAYWQMALAVVAGNL